MLFALCLNLQVGRENATTRAHSGGVVVKKTIHAVCDQTCSNRDVSPAKHSAPAFGTIGVTHVHA
jgi:hypothetical protein